MANVEVIQNAKLAVDELCIIHFPCYRFGKQITCLIYIYTHTHIETYKYTYICIYMYISCYKGWSINLWMEVINNSFPICVLPSQYLNIQNQSAEINFLLRISCHFITYFWCVRHEFSLNKCLWFLDVTLHTRRFCYLSV